MRLAEGFEDFTLSVTNSQIRMMNWSGMLPFGPRATTPFEHTVPRQANLRNGFPEGAWRQFKPRSQNGKPMPFGRIDRFRKQLRASFGCPFTTQKPPLPQSPREHCMGHP
jgi:hypothetical protein